MGSGAPDRHHPPSLATLKRAIGLFPGLPAQISDDDDDCNKQRSHAAALHTRAIGRRGTLQDGRGCSAALRSERPTVVWPDLHGYSPSSKPTSSHHVYSDRNMACDIAAFDDSAWPRAVRRHRSHRGSYVAYRTALDHADRVTHLAVLNSVPIIETLERADAQFAEKWWHWFVFSSEQAERAITADPPSWYHPTASRWVTTTTPAW